MTRADDGTLESGDKEFALAPLLDDARSLIVDRQKSRATIRLHVGPDTYRALAEMRAFDLSRGNPLLLLGAEVVADPSLPSREFFVAEARPDSDK